MKRIVTWTLLLQKRILIKPMFQITILLIPLILVLLFSFSNQSEGLIRVAVYCEDRSESGELADSMLEKSDDVIRYYEVDSEEQLYSEVETDKAQCGFLIPEDFGEKIELGNRSGLVTVLIKNASVSTRVIEEVLCGELFSAQVFQMTEQFIEREGAVDISSQEMKTTLRDFYAAYRIPSAMFEFQYTNGEENTLLNGTAENYYMMPVRGLLSVLILVAALGGVFLLSEDDRKGCWQWIHRKSRPLFSVYFIFMSMLAVAAVSFGALFFTGLSTGGGREFLLMAAYCILVCGYSNLIRVLIPNTNLICALMPVIVLLSLILSPVFVNLQSLVPGIKVISLLLPTDFYLGGIYSNAGALRLAAAAVIYLTAGILADLLKMRQQNRG
ncbi:MAG: ABC transporter permease [Lachnospiraceae bacterium]|nr:ABC transporter permease [Lachnospiraceae bacterium]